MHPHHHHMIYEVGEGDEGGGVVADATVLAKQFRHTTANQPARRQKTGAEGGGGHAWLGKGVWVYGEQIIIQFY